MCGAPSISTTILRLKSLAGTTANLPLSCPISSLPETFSIAEDDLDLTGLDRGRSKPPDHNLAGAMEETCLDDKMR